jgi:HEAT repeat protein
MNKQAAKLLKIVSISLVVVLTSLFTYGYCKKQAVIQEVREKKVIQALIKSLKNGDRDTREKAIRVVAEMGETAVEPIVTALRSESRDFRREVAEALIDIGAPAVVPLIDALDDEKMNVRRAAIYALGKNDPDWSSSKAAKDAIPELVNDLKSEDKYLREDAIEMLRKIGEPAVEPLIDALDNEEWHVRQSVAAALGRIRSSRAVEPLINALNDEHWDVRRTAAFALGKMGDGKALKPLEETAKKDTSSDVRMAAKDGLKKLKMLSGLIRERRS